MPGATSFTDLKTSTDGISYNAFKETAMALGLLESDDKWDQCLSEAAVSAMPKQLHSLFVTILIFGEPAKPELWTKYKEVMGEDILRHIPTHLQTSNECVDNEILLLLQEELEEMGLFLKGMAYQPLISKTGSRGYPR